MAAKILVVDRDEAFATMLQDMLETQGGHSVQVARTSREALTHLRRSSANLTIIDMDLGPEDLGYRELILALRQLEPALRVILIPLTAKEVPAGIRQLDIQGILPKPFFADDLLPCIESALAAQVSRSHSAATAAQPAPQPAQKSGPEPQPLLSELAREINADAVLLLSMRPGDEQVISSVSAWEPAKVKTLARQSIATVQAAQATAQVLGQPDGPFEHNMFESDSMRLYMMAVPNDALLVVVTSLSMPLGTIRHNLRRTARSLQGTA